jgi:hypothetical protein
MDDAGTGFIARLGCSPRRATTDNREETVRECTRDCRNLFHVKVFSRSNTRAALFTFTSCGARNVQGTYTQV